MASATLCISRQSCLLINFLLILPSLHVYILAQRTSCLSSHASHIHISLCRDVHSNRHWRQRQLRFLTFAAIGHSLILEYCWIWPYSGDFRKYYVCLIHHKAPNALQPFKSPFKSRPPHLFPQFLYKREQTSTFSQLASHSLVRRDNSMSPNPGYGRSKTEKWREKKNRDRKTENDMHH